MDSAGTSTIKEEERTSESTRTVYQDVPEAPDLRTPPLSMHQLDGPRYTVKPKEYAGEGSWRSYRSHFERVATLNRWREEKLEYLWVNLTGAALGFVEGLPENQKSSYEVLCNALDQRFGAERLAAIHKAELLSRRREPGESLPALGQEVRRLVSCAYPGFPLEAMEEIAVERFLDALDQSEMRLAIHQGSPQTLEEAVEKGLQMEAWQTAEDRKHGKQKVRKATEEEEYLRIVKNLQSQVEELQKDKREVKCFNCGKMGHIARNCRAPSRNKDNNRREVTCYNCGKEGHYASKCRLPRKSGSENE